MRAGLLVARLRGLGAWPATYRHRPSLGIELVWGHRHSGPPPAINVRASMVSPSGAGLPVLDAAPRRRFGQQEGLGGRSHTPRSVGRGSRNAQFAIAAFPGSGIGAGARPGSGGRRALMATGSDLRRIALSLERTAEAPHFDRAALKVVSIYAALAAGGRTAKLKFRPDEQEFKCMMAPEAFAPVPNVWGRQGWTTTTCPSSAPRSSGTHSRRRGRMPYRRDPDADESSGNLGRWQKGPRAEPGLST